MSDFSVVVISYNGKNFLGRCLDALSKSDTKPVKTIVVDDFSNDGTEEMIKEKFSWAEYHKNEKNLGPTASRNRGARYATGEYLIFLDNDTLVEESTFSKLIVFLGNHRDAGIAGAKIAPVGKEKMWWNMGYDPNFLKETVGYIIGLAAVLWPSSKRLKELSTKFILNYWDYDRTLEVDWVVESCFAIREEIFKKINGFDERFYMFFEGPDLCRRVRLLGLKVYFYPGAKAVLLEGHTHSRIKRINYFQKSRYLYYKKHYSHLRSNPIAFTAGRLLSGFFYLLTNYLNKIS